MKAKGEEAAEGVEHPPHAAAAFQVIVLVSLLFALHASARGKLAV
jgi:hypothetical protein